MSRNSSYRYYEKRVDTIFETRSKGRAKEAEVLRRIRREQIAARVEVPPIDLEKFASYLGVQIQYLPLAMKGRLMLDGDTIIIHINIDLSDYEKRFTIAHELAHLILEEKRLTLSLQSASHTNRQLNRPYGLTEHLCDIAAEEILLPTQWLREHISSQGRPSLEIATKLSKEINCDIAFIVKRAIEIRRWHCRLLWWTRSGSKMYVTRSFPIEDQLSLARIEPLDFKTSLLGKCLLDKTFLKGSIRIKNDDLCDDLYPAECIPLGGKEVLSILLYLFTT